MYADLKKSTRSSCIDPGKNIITDYVVTPIDRMQNLLPVRTIDTFA